MKRLEWHFLLEPTVKSQNSEGATRLSLSIDYAMPYSFLGSIIDKVKMNSVINAACQVNLEGLKRKIEG